MSITPEPVAGLLTLIRAALMNELTDQAAAEKTAQLLASWGLTESELKKVIDHRIRLLQEQRKSLDAQTATLAYIRDRAINIHHLKKGATK